MALGEVSDAEAIAPTTTITSEEKEKLASSTKTGVVALGATGAVAGYLIGAATGAKIASAIGTAIAPGLGTVIGAVLGAGLGLLVGSLVGGAATNQDGFDPTTFNLAAESAATYTNADGSAFTAESATDA